VGTHVGGFPNPALTYLITWRTPHACGQRRRQQQLLGTGRCGAANVAVPTANQLRYQTGEIVALTHFNMASFVKNGDPGCTSQNWLTKAPGAVGPSGDPATFNRTPSTPACISTYLSCLPACAGSYPLPPVGRCVCVSATQLDTDQWAEVYRSFGEHWAVSVICVACFDWDLPMSRLFLSRNTEGGNGAPGVKGAVLTAKHGCGHLLWPTNVSFESGAPYTYCVGKKDSAIKQDVLALFSESMQKANITHGFYYSFTNNFYLNVAGHVAGHSKTVLRVCVNNQHVQDWLLFKIG
jgi:hypothetical protein